MTEDDEARRARVARSNHAFGRVLSVVGAALAALAVVFLGVGALLMTAASAAAASGDYSTADSLQGIAGVGMSAAPGVVLLFAMCCLILGEQLRRGSIGRNRTPPNTLLPSASNVSRFTVLGTGWHLLWVVVGLAVCLPLLIVPMASWFTGGWPADLGDYDFGGFWTIYGTIGLGIVFAAAGSLVKKRGYRRAIASGRPADGGPGRRFWRFVDYRWRFDLWLVGFGGVLLAICPTFIATDIGPDGDAAALASHLPLVIAVAVGGIVLVVLGVVASLQYWRAGESLGTGESYA